MGDRGIGKRRGKRGQRRAHARDSGQGRAHPGHGLLLGGLVRAISSWTRTPRALEDLLRRMGLVLLLFLATQIRLGCRPRTGRKSS